MHARSTVDAALALAASGKSASAVARETGVSRSTVREWLAGRVPGRPSALASCERCGANHQAVETLPPAYVYLLGIYLGDGC